MTLSLINFGRKHSRCHWSGLLCGMAFSAASMAAVNPPSQVGGASRVIDELAVLAKGKVKPCPSENLHQAAPQGWLTNGAQCAWNGQLRMQRWIARSGSSNNCLSNAAQGWDWARRQFGDDSSVWHGAWQARSLEHDDAALKRLFFIERSAQGLWVASMWQWTPSPRSATRRWQQARWQQLQQTIAQTPRLETSQKDPLHTIWLRNLRARPAEITPNGWLWQADGRCLQMRQAGGADEPAFFLPQAQEDSRLEQRAAIQVRLARHYPRATWLTPFRQLPVSSSAPRNNAKYEAIWREQNTISGQLWIPDKKEAVRLRIDVTLPSPSSSAHSSARADADNKLQIAQLIEREMSNLAELWSQQYER